MIEIKFNFSSKGSVDNEGGITKSKERERQC